jgi:hypothetical protein
LVQACEDPNPVRKRFIEERVGKAWEERPSHPAMSDRTGERMLSNQIDDQVQRSSETPAKAGLS